MAFDDWAVVVMFVGAGAFIAWALIDKVQRRRRARLIVKVNEDCVGMRANAFTYSTKEKGTNGDKDESEA